MPAPSIADHSKGEMTTSFTHPIPYPPNVAVGDLLLGFFGGWTPGAANGATWEAGWTFLRGQQSGAVRLHCQAKIVDAGDTGDGTFDIVTVPASVGITYFVLRIEDAYQRKLPVDPAALGTETLDPPSVTLVRCPPEVLWVAAIQTDSQDSITAFSSGYTHFTGQYPTGAGSPEFHLGVCAKQTTDGTNTENPGAFTRSGSGTSQTITVGVSPLPFIHLPMSGVGP